VQRRTRDQHGAVAAEQLGVLVLVVAIVAAVWSVALDEGVEEVGEQAVDCLFQTHLDDCELSGVLHDENNENRGEHSDQYDDPAVLEAAVERLPDGTQIVDAATGEVLWAAGDGLTGDPEIVAILRALAAINDHLREVVGRDSFDDLGAPLIVRLNSTTPNAVWLGRGGDLATEYAPGWVLPGVIAHEFGHGLVQFTINLGLDPQERALNESLSDMFASNVTGNWVLDGPNGVVRDISDPGAVCPLGPDNCHPAHVRDYDHGRDRHHRNSNITSHAYYLIVEGGQDVTGIGREAAQRVLYRAMTDHLVSDADRQRGDDRGALERFRDAMLAAAADEFGEDSPEYRGVQQGLDAVGLDEQFRGP
jgi:hypothetical protein